MVARERAVTSSDVPEQMVGQRLTAARQTLATAESCSGGLVAHRLTNVSGSSNYFRGGIVAYSNEVKTALLGVAQDALARHGAVSEPVALQMAKGARDRFGAEWGIGVTGIAGPTGGSPEKPVGLVYIAVAGPNGMIARRCQFTGERLEIKEQTAEMALQMLLEQLP
ncbi:MAG: CinA family protein [Candidatus Hydrogenedentes bacterium]|nr:CinA family protein [Candidatus Hydrogenedentota bacterium]